MGLFLKKSKRDRRFYDCRRKSPYNLDYFLKGGIERRNGNTDRRMTPEFSEDWSGNRTQIATISLNFS